MRRIVVLGAGRSSSALIRYLLTNAVDGDWEVIIGDYSPQLASDAAGTHPRGKGVAFDINDASTADRLLSTADVVISLLPPSLHLAVARMCLSHQKNLITASYTSPEMKSMSAQVASANLIFLNECGLDPGIDHMSAVKELDRLRSKGAIIVGFESFAGGLISPSSCVDNPWRYKFTWNPRNVVMAGQPGPAEYLANGQRMTTPYERLFSETRTVYIDGYGEFEGYANRDSVRYAELYGLNDVKHMLRGTLRFKGFCSAWQVLVSLGCCSDQLAITFPPDATHRDFLSYFLRHKEVTPEQQVSKEFDIAVEGHEMQCLRWSGFFDDEPIGLSKGTPADFVEHILMKKWKLNPGDRDLVLMWHRIVYTVGQKKWETIMHMAVEGEENGLTAMAKTVGLPLGIAARLVLDGRVRGRGVLIPILKDIYDPILTQLNGMGIAFSTRTTEVSDDVF